jgi:hypothetical protein
MKKSIYLKEFCREKYPKLNNFAQVTWKWRCAKCAPPLEGLLAINIEIKARTYSLGGLQHAHIWQTKQIPILIYRLVLAQVYQSLLQDHPSQNHSGQSGINFKRSSETLLN